MQNILKIRPKNKKKIKFNRKYLKIKKNAYNVTLVCTERQPILSDTKIIILLSTTFYYSCWEKLLTVEPLFAFQVQVLGVLYKKMK